MCRKRSVRNLLTGESCQRRSSDPSGHAHAGCGVPARSLDFPTVGTIFSSVQIVDKLSGGESFYLAEVRRIRALAVALHDHVSAIAIVDEPFRGTNVHDAAEATLAVITRLAAHPSALVFIASHIGEVVPAIANDPRIGLFHFAADITTDKPIAPPSGCLLRLRPRDAESAAGVNRQEVIDQARDVITLRE